MIRIAAADKDELFHKMAKKAAELPPVKQGGITDQTIFEALRKREEQFSTALGRGVIFPHASSLSDLKASSARKIIKA